MFDGILTYLADLFPPKPTFKVEDIPDLTGKVIIVTGANSGQSPSGFASVRIDQYWPLGVGKETAKVGLFSSVKIALSLQ